MTTQDYNQLASLEIAARAWLMENCQDMRKQQSLAALLERVANTAKAEQRETDAGIVERNGMNGDCLLACTSDPRKLSAANKVIEAANWVNHLTHGVGKASGDPEHGEWEAALMELSKQFESYDALANGNGETK